MFHLLNTTVASLALIAVSTIAIAQTKPVPAPALASLSTAARPAGARDTDQAMTCADIAAERGMIDAAVAKVAEDKAKSEKRKKKLFGFAKTFASIAVPGMMSGLAGGSAFGSIAAQSAGSTAGNAIGSAQLTSASPAKATPSADQQARLDRLTKIGAFRQCAG